MNPEETDIAIEELETRLERLRGLYEQYFLGIEKIEPTVARKDVDRRFWMLRRVQIRNTARRFRLQVLIQRHNTFQQYWSRICREIENGTYKRHLIKAQKKVGFEPKTWAAKKRLGLLKRDASGQITETSQVDPAAATIDDEDDDMPTLRPPPRAAPTAALTSGVRTIDRLDLDLDLDGPDEVPRPAAAQIEPAVASSGEIGAFRTGRKSPIPLPSGYRPGGLRIPGAPRLPTDTAADPSRPPQRPPLPKKSAAPQAPQPAAPAPVAKKSRESVTDQRIRELHAQLLQTKKTLNQSSSVSVDGLAKSLRATADKLQEKAQGRRVDFEVVVKDGQAVVRPVLRK